MDLFKIAEKIRDVRTNQHMTQIELAKRTGLSNTYISDIENGRTTPSIRSLAKIAEALETDIKYFVDD